MSNSRLSLVGDDDPAFDDTSKHCPGFSIVPAQVLAMKSGYASGVYSALAKYANADGICWPSMETLCDQCGWSRTIVERTLKALEEAGHIVRERRSFQGMKRSNIYRITANVQIVPTVPTIVPTVRTDSTHSANRWYGAYDELEPRELEPRELDIPPKSPKGEVFAPEFLELWASYPKGHGSKGKSYQAWKKIRHQHAAIMAGLAQWHRSERWAKGYIKACELWLRDGLWENPPEGLGQPTQPNRPLSVEQAQAEANARFRESMR